MKRTVCIAGAGPAGLVAAKTLDQTGAFDITIYEKKDRIGGIWALDEDSPDGFLNPNTPTNLSRYTVGFSDHGWDSMDMTSKYDTSEHGTAVDGEDRRNFGKAPMFPKAWQVNRYLESYRDKYVLNGMLHLGHEVIKTERSIEPSVSWNVTTRDRDGEEWNQTFDHLIVASGFFSDPRPAHRDIPNLASSGCDLPIRVIHSSQFRTLRDLFPGERDVSGKSVLLLGGGNSVGEAAAAVALQLSSAQWSPYTEGRDRYKDVKVVHVTPRPIYALPPFVATDSESYSYIPIDFRLYDLSKRPADQPIVAGGGRVEKFVKDIIHGAVQGMVGNDQSDLGAEALKVPGPEQERSPVYVALSEQYAEFVRSGAVEVLAGRVSALESSKGETAVATVRVGNKQAQLDGIAAVIYATGYTPATALSFLPGDVKEKLDFDPDSMRLPLILEQWQTMSPAVPDLSFVGFYEGPYWGVMEMQARLTAERWLNEELPPTRQHEKVDKLLELRKAMQERKLDVPQYWFGDYLGYVEEAAAELKLERNDEGWKEREGMPSPARYLDDKSDKQENADIMTELQKTWQDCLTRGRFVPRAVLRAMQGDWNIHRKIESANAHFSGTLQGTASFHPRIPTARGFDLEYVYIETGSFTMLSSSTTPMTASRRYVYRYSEIKDELSIWFVKPDKQLEVDYLFHKLAFISPDEAKREGGCVAKADHLCVDDMYWTEYRLPMKGISLHDFEIKHTVKGPSKDYVSATNYTRPRKHS